jgi:hypothetical protein
MRARAKLRVAGDLDIDALLVAAGRIVIADGSGDDDDLEGLEALRLGQRLALSRACREGSGELPWGGAGNESGFDDNLFAVTAWPRCSRA